MRNTGEPLSPLLTLAFTMSWQSCTKLVPDTPVLTHVSTTFPCDQPVVRPTLLRVSFNTGVELSAVIRNRSVVTLMLFSAGGFAIMPLTTCHTRA